MNGAFLTACVIQPLQLEKLCKNKKHRGCGVFYLDKLFNSCCNFRILRKSLSTRYSANSATVIGFCLIFVRIFTETFVSITASYNAFADKITLGMQTCWAYFWCLGSNVPIATICATPHYDFIRFE